MMETSGLAPRAPRETRRNCEVPAPRQRPQHCQGPLLTLIPLHVFFSWETHIQHSGDVCQWGDCPASEHLLLPPRQLEVLPGVDKHAEHAGSPRRLQSTYMASFQPESKSKSKGRLLDPIMCTRGMQGIIRRVTWPGSQGRVGGPGQSGPREDPRLPSGTAGAAPLT